MQNFNMPQHASTHTASLRERRLWPHLLLFATMITSSACSKMPEKQAQTQPEKKSYSTLGQEFADTLTRLKKQGSPVDKNEFVLGVRLVLSNSQSGMSKDEVEQLITALQKVMTNTAVTTVAPARGGKFQDDYAKLNAERPGVTVTASGVQYEVLQAGHGKQAKPSDTVMIKYVGKLSNGAGFDTSGKDGEPKSINIDKIAIPGLKEALLLMHEGDKFRVVIPPKMGFVNFGNNRLRRRVLIYDIELVKVESPAK